MENQIAQHKKKVKEGFIGQRMLTLPPHVKRKINANPLTKNFYLTAIGHYPNAIHHDRERKTGSSQYIFLYCTDGSGCIYLNGIAYELRPNTYFIIPKNVPHRYVSDENNPWSIYWVHFIGDIAEGIYERFLNNNSPHVYEIPYDENRIKYFEQIYSILEHSFDDKEVEVASFNLIHFVSSFIYYKEANPAIYSNDTINSSIAFMKKNINAHLGIEELAKQQQISISHYSRSFRQKTGSSPTNYFNQLKVQKACQYLYFTERNIKDIALELGFDDQYYFSRLFRKVAGTSPAKYKKSHKQSNT